MRGGILEPVEAPGRGRGARARQQPNFGPMERISSAATETTRRDPRAR